MLEFFETDSHNHYYLKIKTEDSEGNLYELCHHLDLDIAKSKVYEQIIFWKRSSKDGWEIIGETLWKEV